MAADYYHADTENGDHIDDPSEDALFMLIEDLDHAGNTFVTINPADEAAWYASISLLDDDTYEVERRDADQHVHDLTIHTDPSEIAKDLTVWLAGRHFPNRPA